MSCIGGRRKIRIRPEKGRDAAIDQVLLQLQLGHLKGELQRMGASGGDLGDFADLGRG